MKFIKVGEGGEGVEGDFNGRVRSGWCSEGRDWVIDVGGKGSM